MFNAVLVLLMTAIANPDTRSYELRVYHPSPGKQAATNAIIASFGNKYMAKHHIQMVGAWVPADKTDDRVFVLVVHPDKATAMKNWEALAADEGFKAELAEASKEGKPVASIEREDGRRAVDGEERRQVAAAAGHRLFALEVALIHSSQNTRTMLPAFRFPFPRGDLR